MRFIPRQPRRGSAYLLVIGASLMVTIIGFAIVTVTQINGRILNQTNDASECETLAQAALEYAAVTINNDALWRTDYQNSYSPPAKSLGRGTITFKITDTSGNSISSTNTAQPVKIWGIARIGTTCRIFSCTYSQQVQPLAVLKTAMHSGSTMTAAHNLTATNGPISANTTMSITGAVTGSVQATVITKTGTVSGKTTTLTAPLTMPPATTYSTYYAYGTDLPYSLTGNIIQNCLISSASNPYGPVNPYGVYRINIPAGQTLSIKNSRIVGTLVINLGVGSTLNIISPLLIQSAREDFPAMIINTTTTGTVHFQSTNNTLNEGGPIPNLNPPGTPYNGATNATTTDQYPSTIIGVVHIIGAGATIQFDSNFSLFGTLIADAPLSPNDQTVLQADTNLAKFPPMGFTQIGPMVPLSGTYRREIDQ